MVRTLKERGIAAFTRFGAAFYSACVSDADVEPKKIIDNWDLNRALHEMARSAGESAADAGRMADKANDYIDQIQVADF
jgi:hypothetical protein